MLLINRSSRSLSPEFLIVMRRLSVAGQRRAANDSQTDRDPQERSR
jgi:hypothetical protein